MNSTLGHFSRRAVRLAPLPLVLMLFGAQARAEPPTVEARSAEVVVSEQGGQVDVKTHPSIITSLFMPEPIARLLASDKENFTIHTLDNAVVLRPREGRTGLSANLVITTKTMRLTVVLHVVDDPAKANPQVTFRKATDERRAEQRIEREVSRRMNTERTRLRETVERELAARVFQGVDTRRLGAIERNDENIIVKVPRASRIGDDVYLAFSIQNRSGSTYQLGQVQALAGDDDRAGAVIVEGKATGGPVLARVASGENIDALVVVRGGARRAKVIELVVSEAGGGRAVRVDEVPLP